MGKMFSEAFKSVQLAFIKRFEFPEPVFYPGNLRRRKLLSNNDDYRFFSNPDAMNRLINSMKQTRMPVGTMKPIRNLNIPKDNFWRPFRYKELDLRIGLEEKAQKY
ncbi:MAG: hypothetical protein HXS54_08955 [Theionarchaea archaeon]|nr:hypothetical protein [Theionarchaea archaeon]